MTAPTMTRVVVHAPSCPDTRKPNVIVAKPMLARDADDYALPHTCLPGGLAGTFVVQVVERVATHPYRAGKVQPVGARRPLCAECRHPLHHHPRG